MNKYELSDWYDWLANDAREKGLDQKAAEYTEIGRLLFHQAMVDERGHTPLDIGRIMNWKPHFEDLDDSWPPLYYRDEEQSWLSAVWDWLTDHWNWDKCTSPSFPAFFHDIWENVKTVFLWYLSPWFHLRYWFLSAFVNLNDGKLLDCEVNWAHIRNRKSDTAYYTLRLCGFHYTLTKTQFLKSGEEGGQSIFIQSMILAFSDLSDEERQKKADELKEFKTEVCSGWIFGWKSFAREFNKIVEKTPDLDWERIF